MAVVPFKRSTRAHLLKNVEPSGGLSANLCTRSGNCPCTAKDILRRSQPLLMAGNPQASPNIFPFVFRPTNALLFTFSCIICSSHNETWTAIALDADESLRLCRVFPMPVWGESGERNVASVHPESRLIQMPDVEHEDPARRSSTPSPPPSLMENPGEIVEEP